ncbi:MAG: hypothetical protein KGM99_12680 [Burkholderiales bacterium]|nr:hypothetical protein [Burkholderiales bacterium]
MQSRYLKLSTFLLVLGLAGSALAQQEKVFFGAGFGTFLGSDPARKEELLRKRQERLMERQASKEASRNLERCFSNNANDENKCAQQEGLVKRNRLTPEERRALRRQIRDAGQELYRPVR